jgi:hypothetical protein
MECLMTRRPFADLAALSPWNVMQGPSSPGYLTRDGGHFQGQLFAARQTRSPQPAHSLRHSMELHSPRPGLWRPEWDLALGWDICTFCKFRTYIVASLDMDFLDHSQSLANHSI